MCYFGVLQDPRRPWWIGPSKDLRHGRDWWKKTNSRGFREVHKRKRKKKKTKVADVDLTLNKDRLPKILTFIAPGIAN